jgi:hypothetical protein
MKTTEQLKAEAKRISERRYATGCEWLDAAKYQAIVEELLRRGEWDW